VWTHIAEASDDHDPSPLSASPLSHRREPRCDPEWLAISQPAQLHSREPMRGSNCVSAFCYGISPGRDDVTLGPEPVMTDGSG
jgi:hypothetical protein